MLHISVPIIFFEHGIYSVSEEVGSINVTVLSNGEHLTPVHFSVQTTNDSAIGETNLPRCIHNVDCHFVFQLVWTMLFQGDHSL